MRKFHVAIIASVAAGLTFTAFAQDSSRSRPSRNAPPEINVIYPHPGQTIAPVDSTFVIGSVTPGSRLTINGQAIDVYRTGGFLGWVGVEPGEFTFRLRARNDHGSDSLNLNVKITDDRPLPMGSEARIREGSLRPQWHRTVRAGDEVSVSFDGTMGGTARFWMIAGRDTLGPHPMTELKSRALATYESYRQDEMFAPDSLLSGGPTPSRGRYHGVWRVPSGLGPDSLRVRVELKAGAGRADVVRASPPGLLIPVDSRSPRVVELTDSTQILRTGPRMGYFSINQPYGVRALWHGENGPWTIVQPAPGFEAWIETEKTQLLPEGTPVPESIIPRLNTVATERSVRLEVGMSERLSFQVSIDDDLESVTLHLYGAVSNTDWIEQDSTDDIFKNITWSQIEPRLYGVAAELKGPIWGYDARYEGSKFVLEVFRTPIEKGSLEGLTICVDAGHSADPGAVGPTGLVEKDANLRIAQALRAQLEAEGAEVVMTRIGNEDVPLAQRPGIAWSGGADLFVSVHNNAVPDGVDPRKRNGTATYYHHPHSQALAAAVHSRVRQATGLADYGLTQANFAVIRPPQYPSILVECAFIILPEQEEMLDNDAFVTRTAHGIADGIADFVKQSHKQD